MPQTSKRAKRERRLKRQNSLLFAAEGARQYARQVEQAYRELAQREQGARAALLAVLASAPDESLTVTRLLVNQIMGNFAEYDWTMVLQGDQMTFQLVRVQRDTQASPQEAGHENQQTIGYQDASPTQPGEAVEQGSPEQVQASASAQGPDPRD